MPSPTDPTSGQIVTGAATPIPDDATAGTVFTATASCTGNTTLLSGGYTLSDNDPNLHDLTMTEDAPTASGENGVWSATVEVDRTFTTTSAGSLTAYAVCSG